MGAKGTSPCPWPRPPRPATGGYSMAVQVRIPSLLRREVGGASQLSTQGKTIGQVLADIERQFPGFRDKVLEGDGRLRQFVNIFVNDEDIRFLQEMETPLGDGDVVSILPAVA